MNQKTLDLIAMTDAVAINPRDTVNEVNYLAECAVKYGYPLVFVSQCFTEYMIEKLKGTGVKVGGGIGNSTGAGEEPFAFKLASVKHWVKAGCGEIEMFLNIPFMRSGMFDEAQKEIKAIRNETSTVFKLILNTPLLTDEQIQIACEMAVNAGCDFVKTGTGVFGPTKMESVALIRQTVGDRIRIKASGGISDLETIDQLKSLGVTRLGISNTKLLGMIGELEEE
jgi:deoxyribose-phosphate aldolase